LRGLWIAIYREDGRKRDETIHACGVFLSGWNPKEGGESGSSDGRRASSDTGKNANERKENRR
jgi:hypothetical protein